MVTALCLKCRVRLITCPLVAKSRTCFGCRMCTTCRLFVISVVVGWCIFITQSTWRIVALGPLRIFAWGTCRGRSAWCAWRVVTCWICIALSSPFTFRTSSYRKRTRNGVPKTDVHCFYDT